MDMTQVRRKLDEKHSRSFFFLLLDWHKLDWHYAITCELLEIAVRLEIQCPICYALFLDKFYKKRRTAD
jgi:hypothetical protein